MTVKRLKMRRTGRRLPKGRNSISRWAIISAVVIVAAVTAVLVYLNGMQRPEKYVDTWKEADSAANSGNTGNSNKNNSAAKSNTPKTQKTPKNLGLAALNADDFYKVQQKNYPIIKVKQKNPDIQNFLIMGIDGGDPGAVGQNRADCIMIASVNKKANTLSITSLMRDTKTYFPNTQSWHKLNAAYSYGGPGLQIDVINYAYRLDIQKYIQVDYAGFQKIINLVNGIPVTLTAREASYSYIDVGKKSGRYNLSGEQALGYVRTREIDNDFYRTQRQRNVLQALHNKFKSASMQQKLTVTTACIGYIKTNISTSELLGSLLSFESGMKSDIRQLEVPSEGDGFYTTERYPVFFWNLNWRKEDQRLSSFIYGRDNH